MRPRLVLPPHAPGMRIGLFGGTFDPPHAAHLGAALLAMKRLQLDRVWWLVTPGNPLKDTRGLQPLEQRMAAARALAGHPRIDVTGLEAVIKTRYTYDTLEFLVRRCPGVQFVWVMGADNLRSFYRWQNWRGIADAPADGGGGPHGLEPLRRPAAAPPRRWPATACRNGWPRSLPDRKPPAWVYLHGLKSPLSSTALRRSAGQRGRMIRTAGTGIRKSPIRKARLKPLRLRAYLNDSGPGDSAAVSGNRKERTPVPHRSSSGQRSSRARTRLQAS